MYSRVNIQGYLDEEINISLNLMRLFLSFVLGYV